MGDEQEGKKWKMEGGKSIVESSGQDLVAVAVGLGERV